jgi:hypothetical protein
VRYIRRLFKDPVAPDGRWGLLYLMPGGQGIYDPGMAERQAAGGGFTSFNPAISAPGGTTLPPGATAINQDPTGTGVPQSPGDVPGALPGGGFPGLPTPPKADTWGDAGEDASSISEPALGWPIVGVVSRASGWHAENTYKVYKGHTQVNEWQFHVFDRGIQINEPGTGPVVNPASGAWGPGFGGHSKTGNPGARRSPIQGGANQMGGGARTGGSGPKWDPRGGASDVPTGPDKGKR